MKNAQPRSAYTHASTTAREVIAGLHSQAFEVAVGEFVASDEPLFTRVRRLWERTADPGSRAYLRLFFEVYAAALREPRRHASFLSGVVDEWLSLLGPMLEREGVAAADSTIVATELLALHHGCTLDLLATGDHDRVDAAYRSRLAEVEARVRG